MYWFHTLDIMHTICNYTFKMIVFIHMYNPDTKWCIVQSILLQCVAGSQDNTLNIGTYLILQKWIDYEIEKTKTLRVHFTIIIQRRFTSSYPNQFSIPCTEFAYKNKHITKQQMYLPNVCHTYKIGRSKAMIELLN